MGRGTGLQVPPHEAAAVCRAAPRGQVPGGHRVVGSGSSLSVEGKQPKTDSGPHGRPRAEGRGRGPGGLVCIPALPPQLCGVDSLSSSVKWDDAHCCTSEGGLEVNVWEDSTGLAHSQSAGTGLG